MNREHYTLFSPGKIAHLTLKNRLIRSATYEAAMTADGRATPEILDLYRRLAEGGVGTIITGHMAVARDGKGGEKQICIYEDGYIDEVAKLAEAARSANNGCTIIAQVTHAGRQVLHDNAVADCVGPSKVPSPILKKQARELSKEEIRRLVECYCSAIERVKKAGFDGVQLHGAHGYLLSSFLSPYTNQREDEYGGSIENRLRIIKEIIDRAREAVDDFPILIKMNCTDHIPEGVDSNAFRRTAKGLEDLGIDAIEVSGGMWDCLARTESELGFAPVPIPESRTRINSIDKQSYFVDQAETLSLNIPIIVVGGHRNVEYLEGIINRGIIDFLALSRPLISEPDLPNRWMKGMGSEKTDCVSCNSCLLETSSAFTRCVLKQNRLKHKMVKTVFPHTWKLGFK